MKKPPSVPPLSGQGSVRVVHQTRKNDSSIPYETKLGQARPEHISTIIPRALMCLYPIGHQHGSDHWHMVRCKRESCDYCGRLRRASFIRRVSQMDHLQRMLTIGLPDHGNVSAERLRYFNRKSAVLKQYLDRKYGKQPKPAWSVERGDNDGLHRHVLLGDYGYIDLPEVRKWMLRNGLCDWTEDGRLVPWYIRYELLRNKDQAIKYTAAYVAKGAQKSWPTYARIRYCPIPEERKQSLCGPHQFVPRCCHLEVKGRPNLNDRIAFAETFHVDCFDCLSILRSLRTSAVPLAQPEAATLNEKGVAGDGAASNDLRNAEHRSTPKYQNCRCDGGDWCICAAIDRASSMFSAIEIRHRVFVSGQEVVK
jgi:hypothetical protein